MSNTEFKAPVAQLTLTGTEDEGIAYKFTFDPPFTGTEEEVPATHAFMSRIITQSVMPYMAEDSEESPSLEDRTIN